VFARRRGYVHEVRALAVGVAAVHLGGGRRAKEDAIDHSVGVVCRKKRGDAVEDGEPLAEIHARSETEAETAAAEVAAAYVVADEPPRRRPIVLDTLA
jgi:thymidine phosphorylase